MNVAPVFPRSRKTAMFTPIRESSGKSPLVAVTYEVVLPFDQDRKAFSSWASRRMRPMHVQTSASGASRITIGAER
jgi:hypothetical protein